MLANNPTASVGTLGRFVIYKLWVRPPPSLDPPLILGTVTVLRVILEYL